MPPPDEQRNHGLNNARSGVDQAWDLVARAPTQCQTSCHRPLRKQEPPGPSLRERVEWSASHIDALEFTEAGFRPFTLVMSPADRAAFRQVATDWELSNSRIINFTPPSSYSVSACPIMDDVNTLLAHYYVRRESATVFDLNGNVLAYQEWTIPLEHDPIGQAIIDIIATVGIGLFVSLARSMAAGALARAGSALTEASIVVARGISKEAETAVLLFFRSRRAQAIVEALQRAGIPVIVNIGGEAGPAELAKFGEQIALNDGVRFSATRRYVPNLVKEPGENIGKVFKSESVDKVVSRRLDQGFDTDKVAQGAFKVLKRGGKLEMQVFSPSSAFSKQFVQSLEKARFKIEAPGNSGTFRAIKP
jgi:hypothetical protein